MSEKFQNKIVKRGAKGELIVISGNPSEQAIRNFFSTAPVTDYVGKPTNKVSQCSVINTLLEQGIDVKAIAEKIIKMKVFPADPSKYDYDNEAIAKASLQRVRRHVASLQGKGISESHRQALISARIAR